MKKLYKIMTVALAGVLAVGCNDLDTEPLGSTVTSKQKEEVLAVDPSATENAVNSLQAGTHIAGQFYSNQHRDFGLASLFIGLDSRGTDLFGPDDGYNWYSAEGSFGDWQGNYYANLIFWQYHYAMIYTCNSIASTISADTDIATMQYTLGEALASRAYSYYMLANMYQLTYAKDPDAPCVPILTELNMVEAGMNGNPRATVSQVWDQVISDATTAITLLEKAQAAGVERADKRFVDAAVAYGIRARAYLFTLRYAEAAADAQKAIELCAAQGITPLSIAEASVPGFYDLSSHNYMWGIENLPSAVMTQGVNNFASMMGAWMPNGYCSVGCTRRISKKLYAQIPATDARKNWWLDGSANIPAALPSAYAAYINAVKGSGAEFQPYMQVKFGAADNNPGTTSGATDIPIMRVEEMYLILAEAQGMTSPSTGAQTLNSFVKTYRNPSYNCTASTKEALQEAVWLQRRIELWGEGFAYFDILRFQTGIDRRGHGFPEAWVFVVDANDPVMRYQIVQPEVQANTQISEADVLEGMDWITPKPVADED